MDQVQNPTSSTKERALLLPLDAPQRIVTFVDCGQIYTYTFGQILEEDWLRLGGGALATGTAAPALRSLIIEAEGYTGDFRQRTDWRDLLPRQHLSTAYKLLRSASVEEEDGAQITLSAFWGMAAPGKMNRYDGLVHRFRSCDRHVRKKIENRRNKIQRRARSTDDLAYAFVPLMVRLYDELIEEVHGYSLAGREITIEDAREHMDVGHKIEAVAALAPWREIQ